MNESEFPIRRTRHDGLGVAPADVRARWLTSFDANGAHARSNGNAQE